MLPAPLGETVTIAHGSARKRRDLPKTYLQTPTLPSTVRYRARTPQRPSQDSPLSCGLLLTILGTGEPRVPRRARPRTRFNATETTPWKAPRPGEKHRTPGNTSARERGSVCEVPPGVDARWRHAAAPRPAPASAAAAPRRRLHAGKDGAGRQPLAPQTRKSWRLGAGAKRHGLHRIRRLTTAFVHSSQRTGNHPLDFHLRSV